MVKGLEKLIVVFGIFLFLLLLILGSVVNSETLSLIFASFLPFLLLPMRNLLFMRKRKMTIFYALIELLVLLLALGSTVVLFLADCSFIPRTTIIVFVWIISFACMAVLSIPGFFMKKEKERVPIENHWFSYFLLLAPSLCTLFSDMLSFFDLLFIASFLVGWLKNKDIYLRVEYQKWYGILFVLAILAHHNLAILLLPILYFQLDKEPSH